jgi:photosystem II stability/assembly factor-like uncharacterized protein
MVRCTFAQVLVCLLIGVSLAWDVRAEGSSFYAGWTVGAPWHGYGTILRSSDSGNSWSRQGFGQIANVDLESVAAVNRYSAWVVGEASDGYATIYHTSDGGGTWSRMGSVADVPNATLDKVYALNDSNVWAVGSGTIIHTTDGGATWSNQLPAGYESTHLQGVFALDATNVWVTGGTNASYATILKSSDAGASWIQQSGGDVTNANHLLGISAADAQTAWAVGGTGDRYIALRTTDGGATWTEQAGLIGSYDANEVCAVSTSVVWTACDRSLYRSTDGGASWVGAWAGDYTVGLSAVNDLEAWGARALYNGTIYHTSDGGTNWAQINQLGGENLPGLKAISFASQAIPEPSPFMLCLGCLGIGVFWLRRRRQAGASCFR